MIGLIRRDYLGEDLGDDLEDDISEFNDDSFYRNLNNFALAIKLSGFVDILDEQQDA